MPEPGNPELKNEDTGKLKDRVKKLEDAIHFLLKGCRKVQSEIEDEWGVSTFGDGEHYGVRFSEE